MDDVVARMWTDLIGRISGPMSFRIILQPVMAILLAFRDGLADARAGRPPYLWTIFHNERDRRQLLVSGWRAMGRVITLAIIMDTIYQWQVFGRFYPFELVNVVLLLAVVPYVLWRGVVTLLVRRRVGR
jgi:hypothetical protein